MERDEAYVPKTRTDLGIPADATPSDLAEFFEDAPLYNMIMLIRQQIFAFDAYLRKPTPVCLELSLTHVQCTMFRDR